MNDDTRLDELAGLILDGKRVDWKAEGSQGSIGDTAMLAELEVLAEIVELHRRDQAGSDAIRSGPDDGQAAAAGIGTWGTLTLVEKVGEGAFAEVYRARDPHLDRDVALKLLRDSGPDAALGAAVVEEGRLLAAVRHPNVVVVHGAGTFNGRIGIWTEFVQGQTLEDVLADHGPFGAHETALVGIDLCRALAAVHGSGVIHRDVKARNVMRERGGRLVLMDFGMGAAATEARSDRASSGGTPLYMAPELFEGRPATVQSDIYALGVLLWHLLTGAYPVSGVSLQDVRAAHKAGRRGRLRDERPDLPAAIIAAIERAVETDPLGRFRSAGDFEAALNEALVVDPARSTPPAAFVEPGSSGPNRTARGWAPVAWVAACAAAIVLLVVGVIWFFVGRAPARAPVGFEARDWILVGRFENRTGDVRLDGTVERALERELANSRFVNVVPRERVDDALKLMKRPAGTAIEADVGLEVCRRDGGIKGLLTGRTERLGSSLVVSATLLDPAAGGRVVMAASAQAVDESALMAAVRAISDQLRARLGEASQDVAASSQRMEKVTTPSWAALQLYTAGMAATNERKFAEAARLLTQAVEADPDFASAHILLAHALKNTYKAESEYLPHAKRAAELADRTSERERGFILGSYYSMIGDDERAASEYQALLRFYPDDYWALNNLRFVLVRLGRREATWPLSVRMAEVRPNDFIANMAAGRAMMEAGRSMAEVRPFIARMGTLDASPGLPMFRTWLRVFPACDAWVSGDLNGAIRIAGAIAADQRATRTDLIGAGELYLGMGQVAAAERVFRLLPTEVERAIRLAQAADWRGDSGAVGDRLREAVAETRRPGVLAPVDLDTLDAFNELTILLAESGRLSEARRLIAARPADSVAEWVASEIALAERPDAETIAAAERMMIEHTPPRSITALRLVGRIAAALADIGEVPRAARLLEQATGSSMACHPTGPAMAQWLSVRGRLASLYRRMGRDSEADAIAAHLAKLLAQADPDFVLLKDLPR